MTDCVVIRGGKPYSGLQGLAYFEGISAESAGAQALCMHLLEMLRQPYNPSDEPCRAVIARTDPNEQEGVVLLPDLDARVPAQPITRFRRAQLAFSCASGHGHGLSSPQSVPPPS